MGFDEATIERFWSKVDKRGPDECWPWLGFCWDSGYGCFWYNGKNFRANRFSLLISVGEPESGQLACHTCSNKSCTNPKHLYWGTGSENTADMERDFPESPNIGTRFGSQHRDIAFRYNRLEKSQIEYMKLLMLYGYNNIEISKWYACSKQQVSNIRTGKSHGDIVPAQLRQVAPIHRPTRIRRNVGPLNYKVAEEIRSMLRVGISRKKVAAHFSVAPQTISKIHLNQLWKSRV